MAAVGPRVQNMITAIILLVSQLDKPGVAQAIKQTLCAVLSLAWKARCTVPPLLYGRNWNLEEGRSRPLLVRMRLMQAPRHSLSSP